MLLSVSTCLLLSCTLSHHLGLVLQCMSSTIISKPHLRSVLRHQRTLFPKSRPGSRRSRQNQEYQAAKKLKFYNDHARANLQPSGSQGPMMSGPLAPRVINVPRYQFNTFILTHCSINSQNTEHNIINYHKKRPVNSIISGAWQTKPALLLADISH